MKTFSEILDIPENFFQTMIRKSNIMHKLEELRVRAAMRKNMIRADHFEKRYDKLESLGFFRIF